ATSPPGASTPSARSSRRGRSTSPPHSCSCASAASRSTCSRRRRSTRRRSTWKGVHVSSQREPRSYAANWRTLYPHRLLRLELHVVERRVLRREAGPSVARALRAALRHGRGEQHLLSSAAEVFGRRLGRSDATGLPLLDQGEPLPDAHQAAHGSARWG